MSETVKSEAKSSEAVSPAAAGKPDKSAASKADAVAASPAQTALDQVEPAKADPVENAPVKKAAPKSTPSKTATAKKAPTAKVAAKAPTAKKTPVKKTPVKKTPVKKTPAEKAAAKKAPAKKVAASKPAPARKAKATAENKTPVRAPVKTTETKAPAAARSVKTTKAAPANPFTPINFEELIMATTSTDFTAHASQMAADMQDRMKTAYEKSGEVVEEMNDFTKGNVEAFAESGKVFMGGAQEMLNDTVESSKSMVETMTQDAQKMASIKTPAELMELQSEIARRNFDAMVSFSSERTEALVKLYTEAFAPISNRVSVASEKMTKAA